MVARSEFNFWALGTFVIYVYSTFIIRSVEYRGYHETPALRDQLRSMLRDERGEKSAYTRVSPGQLAATQ